jgi:hypothetical protein
MSSSNFARVATSAKLVEKFESKDDRSSSIFFTYLVFITIFFKLAPDVVNA